MSKRVLLIAAMAATLWLPAMGQVKANATITDVAQYEGPDREKKLAEGAKKEGVLELYSSAPVEDLTALTEAFQAKYGVKVSVWRSASERILQRVQLENRGNRGSADVIDTNGPELEQLHRDKALERVKSPYHSDLLPQAVRPHGGWASHRLNVFTQAYNTKLIKKEDLPKTWEDLANPKWKGKVGIEHEDSEWLAGQFAEVGEARAKKAFQDIVKNNGVTVRNGHTLLSNLVGSGEIPLALTVYNYRIEQMKQKGMDIEWFTIGTAIARPNGIAVAKRAAHPHAAVLFYDFLLSPDGQKFLAARGFVPTNRKFETPLNKVPMKFIDPGISLDEDKKWKALYHELFVQPSKEAAKRG